MIQLVRLVIDDCWTAPAAAAALRHQVPDTVVLRRVQARVLKSLAESVTPAGERAAATLEVALASR